MNPLSTSRNKYHKNEKNSSIYTPINVANFIRTILMSYVILNRKRGHSFKIVDTSVGAGNLLKVWKERFLSDVWTIGYDIENVKNREGVDEFHNKNFLDLDISHKRNDIGLVIQNPPFNNTKEIKEYLKSIKKGKSLLPELFLEKTWKLYGSDVPCVCFCPMGILLNQRTFSKRWKKMRDNFPSISSIISLPLDIFPNVEFHNLVLIFNVEGLNAHYFLPEKFLS